VLSSGIGFHAAAIDSDSNALKKALMGLGELGLLGLRVSTVGRFGSQ